MASTRRATPVVAAPAGRESRRADGSPAPLRLLAALALTVVVALAAVVFGAAPAGAQQAPPPPAPPVEIPPAPTASGPGEVRDPAAPGPAEPTAPGETTDPNQVTVAVELPDEQIEPSQSVLIILGLTILAIAPSLLIMMTSFTRMVVVLSLTRNALGLQGIPPNQVIVGMALFLSLFVMAPTLETMNEVALQPYLDGQLTLDQALQAAEVPLKEFMLANTRRSELALFLAADDQPILENPQEAPMVVVIPAFILSELKTAFIIGFVVFIPFLVIDLVVSSVLMALGMMMLPPVFVSLPFKLLLFVMVDGWALLTGSLLASFGTL